MSFLRHKIDRVIVSMAAPELQLHKAGNGYIGKVIVTEDMGKEEAVMPPQRVLVMDNSGSMGDWSRQMVHTVFPEFLKLLGADLEENILLILFSAGTSHHHLKVGGLSTFQLPQQSTTQMKGVFHALQTQLDVSNPFVQLLAVSDGRVNDQQQTAEAATKVASALKPHYQIESRAVRLLTSLSAQPDTKALASILQLNTHSAATLLDLKGETSEIKEMPKKIANMFSQVQHKSFKLQSNSALLQLQPWDEPTDQIKLKLGKNTFWLAAPPNEASINGVLMRLKSCEPMTSSTMHTILEDQLEFFTTHLKVLKVIDTADAKAQISRIVEYFKGLEASLPPDEELAPLLAGGGLKNRSLFLRKTFQRRLRSVTTMLENIANDDRVHALNAAQQADYLRQMSVSKNSKALAKRAQTAGMEFDAVLRKEILRMKDNLGDLDGIDTDKQPVSFYSQASTVDGIKEVCAMADDAEVFEVLTAVDLLRLFNVVGIPAVGPVADFPDPMTYRLDQLMPGSLISVASFCC